MTNTKIDAGLKELEKIIEERKLKYTVTSEDRMRLKIHELRRILMAIKESEKSKSWQGQFNPIGTNSGTNPIPRHPCQSPQGFNPMATVEDDPILNIYRKYKYEQMPVPNKLMWQAIKEYCKMKGVE